MSRKSFETENDLRLTEMLDVIFSYARGDLAKRGRLSNDDSVVDGLMAGINILGEELQVYRAENKQAEEQLRLAARYSRRLIEAGMDPLVTINAEGKIMDVNEAAVQATGLLREWLVGSEFENFFTEPDKAHAAYHEAFSKGRVRNFTLTMRHISGKRTDVLYNAVAFHDEQGEIAGVMAVVRDISDRRRAERAEEMACRDSLTYLYNHGAFYDLLKNEAIRTKRFNRPVSLLMLDIDHFKRVNDTHGHPAGDAILKGLSDVLVEQARAVDNVCRYGGEEFTMILPETDAVPAMQIAERLRAKVQKKRFGIGGGKRIGITISIGVATYPQQAGTLDGVIKAADTALYAAKQRGRNCVSQFGTELPKQNLSIG